MSNDETRLTVGLAPALDAQADTEALKQEFSAFYRDNLPRVLACARTRAPEHFDLPGLVSDVFCLAWKETLQAGQVPSIGWVFGVLRNKIGDLYRKWRTLREVPTDHEDLDVPDDMGLTMQERFEVRHALAQISDGDREVLELTYQFGLSGREVAQALGIGLSAFKMRLLRARQELAKALDAGGEV